MKGRAGPDAPDMRRVSTTRDEARRSYDRISRYYDCLTQPYERKLVDKALAGLSASQGETVLEVGAGTGHCLKRIAESVGSTGRACGIDLSSGMIAVSRERLKKAGLGSRVWLLHGDAATLPFCGNTFDAVFLSFTLELFDTPEIPGVLAEVKRVLKPEGRLAVVSMSRSSRRSLLLSLYEWAHRQWPRYIDCRPIYAADSVKTAGYTIRSKESASLFGLPVQIVVAVNTASEVQ